MEYYNADAEWIDSFHSRKTRASLRKKRPNYFTDGGSKSIKTKQTLKKFVAFYYVAQTSFTITCVLSYVVQNKNKKKLST